MINQEIIEAFCRMVIDELHNLLDEKQTINKLQRVFFCKNYGLGLKSLNKEIQNFTTMTGVVR